MPHTKSLISKYKELEPFLRHNPVCQIMQDYSEAFQAMANTPECYRNEEYQETFKNLQIQSNTCTCGLEKLKMELSLLQEQEKKELDTELENKLIDFANWYLRLIKVTTDKDERYEIENREIVWSFLRGDDYKLWWNKFGESVDQSGIREEFHVWVIPDIQEIFVTDRDHLPSDASEHITFDTWEGAFKLGQFLAKFCGYNLELDNEAGRFAESESQNNT